MSQGFAAYLEFSLAQVPSGMSVVHFSWDLSIVPGEETRYRPEGSLYAFDSLPDEYGWGDYLWEGRTPNFKPEKDDAGNKTRDPMIFALPAVQDETAASNAMMRELDVGLGQCAALHTFLARGCRFFHGGHDGAIVEFTLASE